MSAKSRLRARLVMKVEAKATGMNSPNKVSLGGEWSSTADLADLLESMWSYNRFEGSEFQGIRLVREVV